MSADVRQPAISWGSDGKILIGFYEVVNGQGTYTIGRADDLNQPFGIFLSEFSRIGYVIDKFSFSHVNLARSKPLGSEIATAEKRQYISKRLRPQQILIADRS